jgi:hypothetical protein
MHLSIGGKNPEMQAVKYSATWMGMDNGDRDDEYLSIKRNSINYKKRVRPKRKQKINYIIL